MVKPKTTDNKALSPPPILKQAFRKSLIIYFIAIVILPVICFVFGFQTLDNIGTGFIYGALFCVLFGALTFAGNTVPAQLSKLSLPKYKAPSVKRNQEAEEDNFPAQHKAVKFLLIMLICAAFLAMTGFFIKIAW